MKFKFIFLFGILLLISLGFVSAFIETFASGEGCNSGDVSNLIINLNKYFFYPDNANQTIHFNFDASWPSLPVYRLKIKNVTLIIDGQINKTISFSGNNYQETADFNYNFNSTQQGRTIPYYFNMSVQNSSGSWNICSNWYGDDRNNVYPMNISSIDIITNPIYEFTNTSIQLNLTNSITGYTMPIQAFLIYDGISYQSTKISSNVQNSTFRNNIIIPAVTTTINKSFYWSLVLSGAVGGGSSDVSTTTTETFLQQVEPINFTICNSINTIPFINFTTIDESSLTALNSSFSVSFNLGSKVISYSETSQQNSSFAFCVSPPSSIIPSVTAIIDYGATGYEDRTFYLPSTTLTNQTIYYNLSLINTTSAVKFFSTITETFKPVADAVIYIDKYYVSLGSYRNVEIKQSDDNGAFNSYLTLDSSYKFTIVKTDGSQFIFYKSASCAASPCTIDFSLDAPVTNTLNHFYQANPNKINSTFEITSFAWATDGNGVCFNDMGWSIGAETTSYPISIKAWDYIIYNNGTAKLYGDNSLIQSMISQQIEVSYNETSDIENHFAILEINRTDTGELLVYRTLQYTLNPTNIPLGYCSGFVGWSVANHSLDLFVTLILLITIALVGAWNTSAGVFLTAASIAILKFMNMVYMTWASVTLIIVIAIVIIVKMRN